MTTSGRTRGADRASAWGTMLRKMRRDRGWTLAQLAEKVPMSTSNLSRLELGNQSPPADEVIESIAAALGVGSGELLRAAGRLSGGTSFEESVLERLDAIAKDLKVVKSEQARSR